MKEVSGLTDKLKPCPFCGEDAKVYEIPSIFRNSPFFGILCGSDDCIALTMSADYQTEQEAMKAWNKRA